MPLVTNRRYKKEYVIGGAGIFSTVTDFFKKLAASNAAKAFSSRLASAAQTQLGKTAIEAGKSAAAQIGMKAIESAKDVAVAKVKQLIDNRTARALIPEVGEPSPVITQKTKDILARLVNTDSAAMGVTNLNKLLAGSGVSSGRAIAIQDLVRRLNGSGMKTATTV